MRCIKMLSLEYNKRIKVYHLFALKLFEVENVGNISCFASLIHSNLI